MQRVSFFALFALLQSCDYTHHPIAQVPMDTDRTDFEIPFEARGGSRHQLHIIGDTPIPRGTYDPPRVTADVTVTCDGHSTLDERGLQFGAFWSGASTGFTCGGFRVPGLLFSRTRCTAKVHFNGDMADFQATWRPRLLQVCDDVRE